MWNFIIPAVASVLGSALSADAASDSRESSDQKNYEAQKEFAQMGLQWKTADAKAAGLHPMAAIGGSGAAFSPSFSHSEGPDYSGIAKGLDSLMNDGQETNRAQRAAMTDEDREIHGLRVRRMELENSLLEGQNTQLWASVMGQPSNPPAPGAPVAVQTNAIQAPTVLRPGVIDPQPSKEESHRVGDPGASAGSSPGFRRQRISPNISLDLPSSELAEILEGMGVAGHVLGPLLMAARDGDRRLNGGAPPSTPLPDGYSWQWSRLRQAWQAAPAHVEPGMGRLSRRRREAAFNARKGFN